MVGEQEKETKLSTSEQPQFLPVSNKGVMEEKIAPTIQPPPSSSRPSWFTPRRLLVIFCIINMLNYVDRGVIASNGVNGAATVCTKDGVCKAGSGIQGDFKLSNFEDGVISSAFMVGLLVASPIFATMAKTFNPFRLIGVGLSVWTLAAVGCGASLNLWTIAICRMFVGVGEASFINLAAPFIDDNAPVANKTKWLAAFYMCIPTGIAVGYIYGGWVGGQFGWRYAFFGEAILMVPFVILGFVIRPLHLKGFSPRESGDVLTPGEKHVSEGKASAIARNKGFSKHFSMLWNDIKALMEKVYIVNVLGYIAYNFVIGAYSYWGPKVGYAMYHMSSPDMWFGGITVVCGIVGTLVGGFVLDRMNSTINNAFKLLSAATLLGAIFCFAAFCLSNLYGFIALFSVGELLVFATQAPVNFVCLHCVKPSLRPLSMALSTVMIHICGDVPSSPLVGLFQDHVNNWRLTALVLTSILFLAAAIWFMGIFMHSVDRYNEDDEQSTQSPSKEGKTAQMPKSAEP